jgi:hypothetical protein
MERETQTVGRDLGKGGLGAVASGLEARVMKGVEVGGGEQGARRHGRWKGTGFREIVTPQ